MKTYLVGGAVRDHLLGLPVTERDWVVVGCTPEKMMAEGYIPVGKDFPVFLHPQSHEEYALARTERKSGRGYQGFTFYSAPDITLEQDLIRRDLTINAIAMDMNGNLVDPFHGLNDLQNKILRHVSDAFIEDPVRILRIARFYARFYQYGFDIAPETTMLMRHMVSNGEVDHLVAERVWQETQKALCENHPEKFFECLRMCGALKVIFPELDALYGVPNPPNWHPEIDSGVHNMMVLREAAKLSKDPEVRFAALLHDVGKALTPMSEWPKHHGHEETGVTTAKIFCERLRVPKNYSELAILVTRYHGLVHKIADELNATTIVKLFEKLDAFRRTERFLQFVLACEADARGRPGFENAEYPQKDFILKAFHIAAAVDVNEIIQKGFVGKEIAERLHQARVSAVKNYLYLL